MTKVYLVYVSGIDKTNNCYEYVWAVFTNKRKAQIYCKYKEEVTDKYWLDQFRLKSAKWEVRTEPIWNEDYTKALNRIQAEKLPF